MKHFSCARSDLINDPSSFVTSFSQVNLRAFKQLEMLPVTSKLWYTITPQGVIGHFEKSVLAGPRMTQSKIPLGKGTLRELLSLVIDLSNLNKVDQHERLWKVTGMCTSDKVDRWVHATGKLSADKFTPLARAGYISKQREPFLNCSGCCGRGGDIK